VADGAGMLAAGVSSVSYLNPEAPAAQTPEPGATDADSAMAPAAAAGDSSMQSVTLAVSVANGPTATGIRPARLAKGRTAPHLLTISGANLTGAEAVVVVGGGPGVVVGLPQVSASGRSVTVEVFLLDDAPVGMFDVVVTGPGWATPATPAVRVEIVP
jgi:hypothetical protein